MLGSRSTWVVPGRGYVDDKSLLLLWLLLMVKCSLHINGDEKSIYVVDRVISQGVAAHSVTKSINPVNYHNYSREMDKVIPNYKSKRDDLKCSVITKVSSLLSTRKFKGFSSGLQIIICAYYLN